MSEAVSILAEVVNHGFDWVKARAEFRKVSDSKRATESDRKRATQATLAAAARLEKTLLRLMNVSGSGDLPLRKKKNPLPVDWGKVAGAISKGAGALESVLNAKNTTFVEVIDTEGREVK